MDRMFKVGDRVTVIGPRGRIYTDGVYWNRSMDCLIGKSGEVNFCGHFNEHVPVCMIDFPDRKTYDPGWTKDWVFNEKWLMLSDDNKDLEDDIIAEDIGTLW